MNLSYEFNLVLLFVLRVDESEHYKEDGKYSEPNRQCLLSLLQVNNSSTI